VCVGDCVIDRSSVCSVRVCRWLCDWQEFCVQCVCVGDCVIDRSSVWSSVVSRRVYSHALCSRQVSVMTAYIRAILINNW